MKSSGSSKKGFLPSVVLIGNSAMSLFASGRPKKNTRYAITCDVPTGPDSLATTSHRKPLSTLPSGTWTYLCPSVGTTSYDGGPGQPAACRTLPRKDRGTCLTCEHWFPLDAQRSRRGHRQQHQSPDLIRKGESGERKIGVLFSA